MFLQQGSRFYRHFECHIVIKVAEVRCVVGGMGIILGDLSPFPKRFHQLRGLGQTFSSFGSFNGWGGGWGIFHFLTLPIPRSKGMAIQISFSMNEET